jgi:hypothetical protein
MRYLSTINADRGAGAHLTLVQKGVLSLSVDSRLMPRRNNRLASGPAPVAARWTQGDGELVGFGSGWDAFCDVIDVEVGGGARLPYLQVTRFATSLADRGQ